eukprot:g29752.t1
MSRVGGASNDQEEMNMRYSRRNMLYPTNVPGIAIDSVEQWGNHSRSPFSLTHLLPKGFGVCLRFVSGRCL